MSKQKTKERLSRVVANGIKTGVLKPGRIGVLLERIGRLTDDPRPEGMVLDAIEARMNAPRPDSAYAKLYGEVLGKMLNDLFGQSFRVDQVLDVLRRMDQLVSALSEAESVYRDVSDPLRAAFFRMCGFREDAPGTIPDGNPSLPQIYEHLGRLREMLRIPEYGPLESYALECYLRAGGIDVDALGVGFDLPYGSMPDKRKIGILLDGALRVLDTCDGADTETAMIPERKRMFDDVARFCLCLPESYGHSEKAIIIVEKAPPLVLE